MKTLIKLLVLSLAVCHIVLASQVFAADAAEQYLECDAVESTWEIQKIKAYSGGPCRDRTCDHLIKSQIATYRLCGFPRVLLFFGQ